MDQQFMIGQVNFWGLQHPELTSVGSHFEQELFFGLVIDQNMKLFWKFELLVHLTRVSFGIRLWC